MKPFEVPAQAVLELPTGRRVRVQVAAVQPTGLWIEVPPGAELAFRSRVRLSFPHPEGSLGVNAEVVCPGQRGVGIEIAATTDVIMREVFRAWSAGKAADLAAIRRVSASDFKTVDVPRPRSAEVTDDLPRRTRVPPPAVPAAPPSSDPAALRRIQLAGREVLVVEDDCNVARHLQYGLGRLGARIHVALDGLSGLDILGARTIDVVLLDWMLPHMPGARVLETMRSHAPKLPVAVVSGMMGSPTLRAEVRRLGADEVFPKPFDLARIGDWIARRTLPTVS